MVIDTNDIYILNAPNHLTGGRRNFYVLGLDNALAEYESSMENGENPTLYKAEIAPTGLVMLGEKVK